MLLTKLMLFTKKELLLRLSRIKDIRPCCRETNHTTLASLIWLPATLDVTQRCCNRHSLWSMPRPAGTPSFIITYTHIPFLLYTIQTTPISQILFVFLAASPIYIRSLLAHSSLAFSLRLQSMDHHHHHPPSSAVVVPTGAAATSLATTVINSNNNYQQLCCRWTGCSQRFSDPELLYAHLTTDHVGRKSTGNLCLTCHWDHCHVTVVKRDHITSHLRVHVPLKPHHCSVCIFIISSSHFAKLILLYSIATSRSNVPKILRSMKRHILKSREQQQHVLHNIH